MVLLFFICIFQRAVGNICTFVSRCWHCNYWHDWRIEENRKWTRCARSKSKEFETPSQQSQLYFKWIRNIWYKLHTTELNLLTKFDTRQYSVPISVTQIIRRISPVYIWNIKKMLDSYIWERRKNRTQQSEQQIRCV